MLVYFCLGRRIAPISSGYNKSPLLSLSPLSLVSPPSFRHLTFAVCKDSSRFHLSVAYISQSLYTIKNMHSYTLATVLISASLASTVCGSNIVIPRALQIRQGGDAFIPGTRQGTGSTCVESFGPNSKLCANSGVCYDSSIGDSCCSEGCKSPSVSILHISPPFIKDPR